LEEVVDDCWRWDVFVLAVTFVPTIESCPGTLRRALLRRRCTTVVAVVLSSLIVLAAEGSRAQDRGLAIMEEQRRINSGYQDELVHYKMILINAKGERSERSLEMRTLEGLDSGDKILLIFQDPPDVRGTTLL